jgi:hypothetical protein
MEADVWISQGNGLNFAAIPTWASEISGHEERGKVAAFNGHLIIWGVCIAYWWVTLQAQGHEGRRGRLY